MEYPDATQQDFAQNVAGLTAVDILQSIKLHGDVALRKQTQEELGPIDSYVNYEGKRMLVKEAYQQSVIKKRAEKAAKEKLESEVTIPAESDVTIPAYAQKTPPIAISSQARKCNSFARNSLLKKKHIPTKNVAPDNHQYITPHMTDKHMISEIMPQSISRTDGRVARVRLNLQKAKKRKAYAALVKKDVVALSLVEDSFGNGMSTQEATEELIENFEGLLQND
jgi:hypothetical protein